MKKTILSLVTIAGLTLGMSSCKTEILDSFTAADKESISNTAADAVKSLKATKDLSAYITAYYAESAVVLMPNAEPIQGREGITSFMQTFGDFEMSFNVIDITGNGDLAYVYGKYTLDFIPSGAKDYGKYIEIWRKQADGKWQVVYDIFNTSVPLPAVPDEVN